MEQLRKFIRKELKELKEATVKRPLPNDAKRILFNNLNMRKTHIKNIQAIKSVQPSYRIYLNNNQSFVIKDIGNGFGFGLVIISGKTYDVLDKKQQPLALDALNKLQTGPIMNPTGDEEGADMGGDTGGGGETTPEEPEEEPAEEPAEEPEA